MSSTRVGATKKFADNWTAIFGGGKSPTSSNKAAKKSAVATSKVKSAKKKGAKTSTKKVAKKSAARGKKKGR